MKFTIVKNYRRDAGGRITAKDRKYISMMLKKRVAKGKTKEGVSYFIQENLTFGSKKPTYHVQVRGRGVDGIKRIDIKT